MPASDAAVSLTPPFLTVLDSAKAGCLVFASNLSILNGVLLSGEADVTFSAGAYSLSEPSTSSSPDGGEYSVLTLPAEVYNSITA